MKVDTKDVLNLKTLILSEASKYELWIQPYEKLIETKGEWSIIYFGKAYSHSILKIPKVGDYRTQSELGGQRLEKDPLQEILHQTDQIVNFLQTKFGSKVLYMRLYGIEIDNQFVIMELELIEPMLFFDTHGGSIDNFLTQFEEMMASLG